LKYPSKLNIGNSAARKYKIFIHKMADTHLTPKYSISLQFIAVFAKQDNKNHLKGYLTNKIFHLKR
jgi:hypothetical protein